MSDTSKTAAIVAIAAIVVLGMIFFAPGVLSGIAGQGANVAQTTQVNNPFNQQNNSPPVEVRGLKTGDQYTLSFNHRDAMLETSLAESTNVNSRTMQKTSSGGWGIISGGSGTTVTVGQYDNGQACWTAEAASGQTYMIAKQRTIDANGGLITYFNYEDTDSDGNKEWALCASTANLVPQKDLNSKPDLAINVKWYNVASVTLNSPSDISSIGTTSGTQKNIEWVATGTSAKATPVREIELKINSTSIAKWDEGQSFVTLAGKQYTLAQAYQMGSVTQDGTNTIYKWKFATSGYQDTAKIIEFPQNAFNKDYNTVRMILNLSTDDRLVHTLTIRTMTATDGSASDVTDAVQLNA